MASAGKINGRRESGIGGGAKAAHKTNARWTIVTLARRTLDATTPATRAVLLASAAMFCFFAAFETTRTLAEAQHRLDMTVDMLASALSDATHEQAAIALMRISPTVESSIAVSLLAPDGQIVASTTPGAANLASMTAPDTHSALVAQRQIDGPLGGIIASQDYLPALAPAAFNTFLASCALLFIFAVKLGAKRSRLHDVLSAPSLLQFLESVPAGAACWSKRGQFISSNARFNRFMGNFESGLKPGTPYSEILAELGKAYAVAVIKDDAHGRKSELKCPTGEVLLLEEYPVEGGGFVTLLTDRSEQHIAERQLLETQEQLSKISKQIQDRDEWGDVAYRSQTVFLNGLNHELRTPLNHIIGFAELLSRQTHGALGNNRYVSYADHIKHSGEALLSALSNLIELADLGSGRRQLPSESLQLRDLLTDTNKRFQTQASHAGISFDFEMPEDVLLEGDYQSLLQMLGNVVENALQFTPRSGRVSIVAWAASDGVVLEISDTGIGIPAERLDVLNQSFILGGRSPKGATNGNGLGLAMARTIAELSGGQMKISSSVGIGTTVVISLPSKAGYTPELSQYAA